MQRRLDLVGIGLFAAAIVWTLLAAAIEGGNPLPVVAVLGASAAVLAVSRMASAWAPVGPALVVAVVAIVALVSLPDLVRGTLGGAPLRYANANAALYGSGAVAAAIVFLAVRDRRVRSAAAVVGVGLVAAVLLSGSAAGAIVLALPVVALSVGWRAPRAAVTACAAIFVGALVATTAFAAAGPSSVPDPLRRGLGDLRLELWRDGYDLMSANAASGIGPGRFRLESPTASTSQSYSWAHHGFLHQGAESGVLGYALLAAVFGWGFARLWATPDADGVTALAAGGLAALGVHASVDYVLHFPLIPVVVSALVGAGQVRERRGAASVRPDAVARRAIKAAILPFGVGGLRQAGDVAVLAYHRVGAGEGEIRLEPEAFEAQLAELVEGGDVLSLDDALADGRGGVVLTLDDGYRDFHETVLPLLVRYGVPMTLYLATGPVRARARKGSDALSWSQLREAVSTGLVTVGSHTHSHVNLGGADTDVAREELRRSKRLIEDRLGTPCQHFAYPFGVASPAAEREVRELYESAALAWGTNRAGRIDPYRLERTPILRSDGPLFFRAKVRGLLDHEATVYRVLRRGPWRGETTHEGG